MFAECWLLAVLLVVAVGYIVYDKLIKPQRR